MVPALSTDCDQYTARARTQCCVQYIQFCLAASELNRSPKGCEIKLQLESNLSAWLAEQVQPSTDKLLRNVVRCRARRERPVFGRYCELRFSAWTSREHFFCLE